MTPMEIYDKLVDIGERLAKLKPMSSDPERYHVDKSELLRDLSKLRQDVRLGVVM